MSTRICLFPGSFDPPTLGHMDLIRRGAALFDTLLVAVLRNAGKTGTFSINERVAMLRTCCAGLENVQVASFDGLLADYYRLSGACCVLRGIRSPADAQAEITMASANAALQPGLETLLLPCRPELSHISSSLVREVAAFHGDIRSFVSPEIARQVAAHWSADPFK